MENKKKSTKKNILVGAFVVVIIIGGWFLLKQSKDVVVDSDDGASKTTNSQARKPDGDYDSDFDGLTDKEEEIYGTDPTNPDTDNDTFLDGEEISAGYNPLIPSPDDKITDLKAYLGSIDPEPSIESPDESNLDISLETGKDVVQNYLQETKTPLFLKDSDFFQEAFLEARDGDTEKLDKIIKELKESYRDLQRVTVPIETLQLHKLTLAMMPALIGLFEDLKMSRTDPLKFLASIKSSQELIPYTIAIQFQIASLADKYNIETPK